MRKRNRLSFVFPVLLPVMLQIAPRTQAQQAPYRFVTVNPEHFHAALVQKSAYPAVDSVAYVYAPETSLGVKAHLALIEGYNRRADDPTHWKEVVYTGPDFFERMLKERKGNVVVLAGNNLPKTDYIFRSVSAGLHVFADKPMAIDAAGFTLLKRAFAAAEQHKVVLYDIMTERYQATNALQKELAALPAVFGTLEKGSADSPAVVIESVHHFLKTVSGKPLTRPAWYFDTRQQGEGIVDVSTHLVDIVEWQLFSGQPLREGTDVRMLAAWRWPTVLKPAEFEAVTGLGVWPDFLQKDIVDDGLAVYANGEMDYTLKGVHVRITVRWNYAPPDGGSDTHYEMLKGTRARLVIRQGAAEHFVPELYIEPVTSDAGYAQHLRQAVSRLAVRYPGLALEETSAGWKLAIPEKYRLSHEATFAAVTEKYLGYLKTGRVPDWEKQAMLTKYFTTTEALRVALQTPPGEPAR